MGKLRVSQQALVEKRDSFPKRRLSAEMIVKSRCTGGDVIRHPGFSSRRADGPADTCRVGIPHEQARNCFTPCIRAKPGNASELHWESGLSGEPFVFGYPQLFRERRSSGEDAGCHLQVCPASARTKKQM
jgi:hypothetical protein